MINLFIIISFFLYAPKQINVTYLNHNIVKISWIEEDADKEYLIFYVQGDRVTDFEKVGFYNGATYQQVKHWWIASSLYGYHYVQLQPFGKWILAGVITITANDTSTLAVSALFKLLEYRTR